VFALVQKDHYTPIVIDIELSMLHSLENSPLHAFQEHTLHTLYYYLGPLAKHKQGETKVSKSKTLHGQTSNAIN